MSDVKAFNNCMSVFWRQHEAEFSRFLTSKTGDSEKAADPEKTKVIIVTLAETTPVLEAANLQQDLRRAGIEPWAWVVNNSLAAAQPSSPFLKIRANRELPLISDVEEQYAKRIALTVLQSEEPVGIDLLEEMRSNNEGGICPLHLYFSRLPASSTTFSPSSLVKAAF